MKTLNEMTVKWIRLMLIRLFNFLPIKQNKIFFFSYYGSQYGCNPKYISEFMGRCCPKDTFDIVWAFNSRSDTKARSVNCRVVKNMSLRYFYELCTSRVIVTNFRTTDLYVKRKNQYYIQTWHSSLRLKQIEKDAEEALPPQYVQMAKKDSLKCDLLLSGCDYSTSIFRRAFWYEGEILQRGTPRNDILFEKNDKKRKEILNELSVPEYRKVILYAPTFRKDHGVEIYNLDYSALIQSLESKFGGEWTFFVKLHPHLAAKANLLPNSEHVVNVTSYDDVQELLAISDVLITDYSSLMFDFALTKRPCFLYTPDLDNYIKQDRKLYFNINELPFLSTTNNEELVMGIEAYNEKPYLEALEHFNRSIGTHEEGKACESVVQRITEICFSPKTRSVVYEEV